MSPSRCGRMLLVGKRSLTTSLEGKQPAEAATFTLTNGWPVLSNDTAFTRIRAG